MKSVENLIGIIFFVLIVGKSFSYEYNLKYIRKKVRHQKKTPYKKTSASKKRDTI